LQIRSARPFWGHIVVNIRYEKIVVKMFYKCMLKIYLNRFSKTRCDNCFERMIDVLPFEDYFNKYET